jgi:hypothetical protein
MPLRLNVGVSRKIGLPEYSSVGASCNVEVELDAGLLQNDLEGFHSHVKSAFVAAQEAVDEELARLQAKPSVPIRGNRCANERTHRNSSMDRASRAPFNRTTPAGRVAKPATASQVKAIYAIARTQHADLESLLSEDFGVDRPEDLALAEASKFIDKLKSISVG